jgi:hypothetical protein
MELVRVPAAGVEDTDFREPLCDEEVVANHAGARNVRGTRADG